MIIFLPKQNQNVEDDTTKIKKRKPKATGIAFRLFLLYHICRAIVT